MEWTPLHWGSQVSPIPLLSTVPAARLDGLFRRLRGNQGVAAASDQILSARFNQCLAYRKPVVRFEELHQGPLHLPVPHAFGNVDFLLGKRIDASIVKTCGDVER